jgi:hypothetical protein
MILLIRKIKPPGLVCNMRRCGQLIEHTNPEGNWALILQRYISDDVVRTISIRRLTSAPMPSLRESSLTELKFKLKWT